MPGDQKEAKKIVQKFSRYELTWKQQVAQRYNLKVVKRNFQDGDLVMRRASIGNRNAKDGKYKAK